MNVFLSDTVGEKPFEEFFTTSETLMYDKFCDLASVKFTSRSDESIKIFKQKIASIDPATQARECYLKSIHEFVPTFKYVNADKFFEFEDVVALFDILVSLIFLLILSPLFLCLIVLLRLTGEGEVFFLQERVGRNGVKFDVIKFATMLKNSPNMGSGTITSKNDQRILPVGHLLRKTKINELHSFLMFYMAI